MSGFIVSGSSSNIGKNKKKKKALVSFSQQTQESSIQTVLGGNQSNQEESKQIGSSVGIGVETASYSSGSVFFGGEPAKPKGGTN